MASMTLSSDLPAEEHDKLLVEGFPFLIASTLWEFEHREFQLPSLQRESSSMCWWYLQLPYLPRYCPN